MKLTKEQPVTTAIIFAGGRGTRMGDLTDGNPKPALTVLETPIIGWIIEQLPIEITDVITVLGYKGKMIQALLGDEHDGRNIRYVWQNPPNSGTFGAAKSVFVELGDAFPERVLFLNGDDIIRQSALKKLLRERMGVLTVIDPTPEKFGVVSRSRNGRLLGIEEQPVRPRSHRIYTGAAVLTRKIFAYEHAATLRGEEQLLTPAITALAQDELIRVVDTERQSWFPIGTPEALQSAQQFFAVHADEWA